MSNHALRPAKKPRILVMGDEGMEEVDYDEVAEPDRAAELEDYFKPVALSPKAIDQASRIVPSEHWIRPGLYTWLQSRANLVFSKMAVGDKVGKLGVMRYFFEYDASGPVLSEVKL